MPTPQAPRAPTEIRSKSTRKVFLWPCLALAILTCLIAVYWAQLFASSRAHLQQAEGLIRLDAATTAHAMSEQAATMLRKLDYINQQLSDAWFDNGAASLRKSVARAQAALPDGTVVQVSVADEQGDIVFSNLTPDLAESSAPITRISIADREHFRVPVQAGCEAPHLFISRPVLGRISQQWTVQLSRPLCSGRQLVGVLVLSVSAEHLSQALHDIFPDPLDSVALVREDGAFLARSSLLNTVMGQSVTPTRPFYRSLNLTMASTRIMHRVTECYVILPGDVPPAIRWWSSLV